MATQVINLISSSPEPHRGPAPQNLPSPQHASGQLNSNSKTLNASLTHSNENYGEGKAQQTYRGSVDLSADDFDDTINLTSEVVFCDQGSNKRLRVSPSPDLAGKHQRAFRREQNRSNQSNGPTAVTVVDCTSSPEPICRSIGAAFSTRRSSSRILTTDGDEEDVVRESDPFAGSSSPARVEPRIEYTPLGNSHNHTPQRSTALASHPSTGHLPRQPSPKESFIGTTSLSSDPFASPPTVLPEAHAMKLGQTSDSPHRYGRTKHRERRQIELISSSAPLESCENSPPQRANSHKNIGIVEIESGSDCASDSDELPELVNIKPSQPSRRNRSPLRRSKSDVAPSRVQRKPPKSVEERARDRKAKTDKKDADKAQKRQDRELARIAKKREKEQAAAFAEANKMKTDKKISTPEMIVDLPVGMETSLATQVQTMLQELDVQYDSWQGPIDNVIKWRRKVRSKFDQELGHWVPVPLDVQDECHVLVLLHADQFVDLVRKDELESYINKIENCFDRNHIILLMEGMNTWFRTNRNIRNRQFTSGVRSQELPSTTNRRRHNAPAKEYVPEDLIEDALLQLQVERDMLIHHTTVPLETAQWITIFTQHISTIPYKKQRDQATRGAGFCMESGQVRTGEDNQDIYVKMLQEIVRITAPIAYGVANEFETMTKLVKGLEDGGQGRLEGVRKSANKDGVLSDKTVGNAVSKRLWKVFTGTDEDSTDV